MKQNYIVKKNFFQRKYTVSDLLGILEPMILDFVQIVSTVRTRKEKVQLIKTFNVLLSQSNFPLHPNRYVHNLSNIVLNPTDLEAFSLSIKFCDVRYFDYQKECKMQLVNLYAQNLDLILSLEEECTQFFSHKAIIITFNRRLS